MTKQFDVYRKALSAITRRIQEEADKWQDMIDAVQEENEALEEKRDKYNSVLSAVDKVYEDEIDKINRQKDAIGDVIDAMSEENDEYERQLALQQAAYNFNRAMNQKTKMVYRDGQMVWETDDSAIRDSQDELKDAQLNVNIAELEKKQDDLDLQIQNLEKYKELWAEISNAYQISQDEMNAKALLGQQYAQLVLQNNLNDINLFKEQYLAINQQLQDNTLLIESYEEKVEYYNHLKEQWASVAEAYEIETERECAAMVLGKDWEKAVLEERTGVLESFKETYVGLQEQIAQSAESAAERIAKAAEKAMSAFSNLSSAADGVGNTNVPPAQNPKKPGYYGGGNQTIPHPFHIPQRYASGTSNAKRGLNLVGEDGQELFIDRNGNTSLVTGPTLIPMLGGETVANSFDTKRFLENLRAHPPQFYNPLRGFNAPDISHVLNNVRNTSTVVNNHVSVNCPNVTDHSGVEYLKRELNSLTVKAMQYNWRK